MNLTIKEFIQHVPKNKDRCFICQKKRNGLSGIYNNLNGEHVLPNWIISRFNLNKIKGAGIFLPNETKTKYGDTIPCCKECNTLMGSYFEQDMSSLFSLNFNEFLSKINSDKELYCKVFEWICLIYVKLQIKDSFLLNERNETISDGRTISDEYLAFEKIYHEYMIARRCYSKLLIDESAIGSMFFFEALEFPNISDNYDFQDIVGGCVLIRIGKIALIAITNDSKAVENYHSIKPHFFDKKNFPLTNIQLRELFARISFENECLINRPTFEREKVQPLSDQLILKRSFNYSFLDDYHNKILQAFRFKEATSQELAYFMYICLKPFCMNHPHYHKYLNFYKEGKIITFFKFYN